MIKTLALALIAILSSSAQQSNSDSEEKFGTASVTWYGFQNCTSSSSNSPGPFQTTVALTPGTCILSDGRSVNSGSWTVTCPGTNNPNKDGTLFFCSDNSCNSSCTAFPFKNAGESDKDGTCYNTNQNQTVGAQSFIARCQAGTEAQKQAEQNGAIGKEMFTVGFAAFGAIAIGLTSFSSV